MDNRSTDETEAIGREYAAQDGRIRFIRCEEFVDVHANHNRALRAIDSNSQYVKVLHSDVWIYPECLSRNVDIADEHPQRDLSSELVPTPGYEGASRRVLPVHRRPSWRAKRPFENRCSGPTGSRRFSDVAPLPGGTSVRAEPQVLLDASACGTRTPTFSYRLMLQGDVAFVHQVLTFTRIHPGALTTFSYRVNSYISARASHAAPAMASIAAAGAERSSIDQAPLPAQGLPLRLSAPVAGAPPVTAPAGRSNSSLPPARHRADAHQSRGERGVVVALTAARLLSARTVDAGVRLTEAARGQPRAGRGAGRRCGFLHRSRGAGGDGRVKLFPVIEA